MTAPSGGRARSNAFSYSDAGSSVQKCPLATIRVKARRRDGKALALDLDIRIAGPRFETTTLAQGQAFLDFAKIPPGPYQVEIVAQPPFTDFYLAPKAESLDLPVSGLKEVSFQVEALETLQVKVERKDKKAAGIVEADGKITPRPVAVSLVGPDGASRSVETNPQGGSARFTRLSPGKYQVKVTLSAELATFYRQPPDQSVDLPGSEAVVSLEPHWVRFKLMDGTAEVANAVIKAKTKDGVVKDWTAPGAVTVSELPDDPTIEVIGTERVYEVTSVSS